MFQSNNLKCHFVCACSFSADSIQWDDFHSFFFLRAGVSSAEHWHLACSGIFVIHILLLHLFFLLFLLLLCLQLLLPLLLYVRLLFGCRCFRKSHGVVSLFFFKCCHVLRLRFTNAVDGLTPPPLLFNFCIVIENRCDSSDTWH